MSNLLPRLRAPRLLAAAALLTWSARGSASPQDILGYGARASAMGATGAASALGAEATWANPALLPLGRERALTLGFQVAVPVLRASGQGMPGKIDADTMRGTLIGALLPVPFDGPLRHRVALGLAFFTPTNVIVRGRVLYPDTPQFPLITDRLQTVTVQAGAGFDLGKGIKVGGGVSALAAISGSVLVGIDSSGSVGTKVDDQLVTSYAPLAGVSYDLGESYRVGVTYRGRLEARFAVRIEVSDLGSLTVPPFNIAGLAQFDPWQVQAEVARVRGAWKVALGVTFKRWSAYPGGPEPTVLCPPDKPGCLALKPAPPGFSDTWVPRLGVERTLAERPTWAAFARAGYFFEPSPAPKQRGAETLFDNSRHALTLGGGFDWRGPVPLSFDLFAQGHLLASRSQRPLVGEAKTPSDVKTSGAIWAGGAAATVRF